MPAPATAPATALTSGGKKKLNHFDVSTNSKFSPKIKVFGPDHPVSQLHAFFFNMYIQQLFDSSVDALNAAAEELENKFIAYVDENGVFDEKDLKNLTSLRITVDLPLTMLNEKFEDEVFEEQITPVMLRVVYLVEPNKNTDNETGVLLGKLPTIGANLNSMIQITLGSDAYPILYPYAVLYGSVQILYTNIHNIFTQINEKNNNTHYCMEPFKDEVVGLINRFILKQQYNLPEIIDYDYTNPIDKEQYNSIATMAKDIRTIACSDILHSFHTILLPFHKRLNSGPISLDELTVTVTAIQSMASVYSRILQTVNVNISIMMMNFGVCFVKHNDKGEKMNVSRKFAEKITKGSPDSSVYRKEDVEKFVEDNVINTSWATDSTSRGKLGLMRALRNNIGLIDNTGPPNEEYTYQRVEYANMYIGENNAPFYLMDYLYEQENPLYFKEYTITCNLDLKNDDEGIHAEIIQTLILSYFLTEILTTYYDAYVHIYTDFLKGLDNTPENLAREMGDENRDNFSNMISKEEMKGKYSVLRRAYMDSGALTDKQKEYVQFAALNVYEFVRIPPKEFDPAFGIKVATYAKKVRGDMPSRVPKHE
jgi:hypothetical protein